MFISKRERWAIELRLTSLEDEIDELKKKIESLAGTETPTAVAKRRGRGRPRKTE